MSTPQPTTLDDWQDAAPVDDTDESPADRFDGARYRGDGAAESPASATPDIDETECQDCGAHVSAEFRRVCGDRDGIAWACVECVDALSDLRYAANGRQDRSRLDPGFGRGQ